MHSFTKLAKNSSTAFAVFPLRLSASPLCVDLEGSRRTDDDRRSLGDLADVLVCLNELLDTRLFGKTLSLELPVCGKKTVNARLESGPGSTFCPSFYNLPPLERSYSRWGKYKVVGART